MVLFEVISLEKPFYEINSEEEVCELVLAGKRPALHNFKGSVLPPYLEVMQCCWHQAVRSRLNFKQVIYKLSFKKKPFTTKI